MNSEIEKELHKCILQLKAKGMAMIPSETGWSIVTDFVNTDIINNLLADKNYIFPELLLKESGQLNKYFDKIPDAVFDMMEFSTRPLQLTTDVVLNHPLEGKVALSLLGFRVPKDEFTHQLLYKFGKPLFSVSSTNSNRDLSDRSSLTPDCYVVNLRQSPKFSIESLVIVKFYGNGQFEFLKK